MSDESKVYAVQMVEFNPQAGNLRKGFTLSGVMAFKAGNQVQGASFVPSPIVPIKDPDKLIKVGDRMIPLFELLTGKDPQRPDAYYLSQPGKPNLPVFRRIVADNMDALKRAVDVQSNDRARAGQPSVPAAIVGVRGASERSKEPHVKTVEQILMDGRDPITSEEPAVTSNAPKPETVVGIVEQTNARTMTSKAGCIELEKIKATVTADDLTYIAEHGASKLRDWATREMDLRVATKS